MKLVALILAVALLTSACDSGSSNKNPNPPALNPAQVIQPQPTASLPGGDSLVPGVYFGRIDAVAADGALAFVALCYGPDRALVTPLTSAGQRARQLKPGPGAQLSVFSAPEGRLESGRFVTVSPDMLADVARRNLTLRWWVTTDDRGVTVIEQDSSIRPTAAPDAPCPRS